MAGDRQARIELLLEHFNHPCGRWRMDMPDVAMPGRNPDCGDVVTVYVQFDPEPAAAASRRIATASFVGSGCVISQAAASMLMELLRERLPTVTDVLKMGQEDLAEELGHETVATRPRCATLALGALKAAADKYLRDEERRSTVRPVKRFADSEFEALEAY
jgi:nitrogen fixation protein NifU and related proteins